MAEISLGRLCDKVPNFDADVSRVFVTDRIPLERHKRICRGLVTDFVANHLDISRWYESLKFLRNISVSRFASATFTETSTHFSESRRNEIRALYCSVNRHSFYLPNIVNDIQYMTVSINVESKVEKDKDNPYWIRA